MKVCLQFKLQLENVAEVLPEGEDFRWFLKIKCSNCGELSKWIYVTEEENAPLKGGRGSANMIIRCKICARENSTDILHSHVGSYTVDDSGAFKTVAAFECRGLEVVDYDPRGGFTVFGEGRKTKFQDVGFSEKEWFDYDENMQQSISITEFEYKIIKL